MSPLINVPKDYNKHKIYILNVTHSLPLLSEEGIKDTN